MAKKTWPNNVTNEYVEGDDAGGADWDPSLVRYIFIDGDNGDDNNPGFLDAEPGHVFAPADVFGIAIKTTSRLDQLRPTRGNCRMLVTLWKPRAGGACYDYRVAGDGLGTCDRGRLSGYSLLHDRASDHTNSADDKVQLGYVPHGGPFPIFAANPTPNGTELVLTGAVLGPPELDVLPYRLHVVTAAPAVGKAMTRWGDASGVGAANVITLRGAPSVPLAAADSVALETQGVVVFSLSEMQVPASFDSSGIAPIVPPARRTCPLLVAGFRVAGPTSEARLGSNLAPVVPLYVGVHSSAFQGTEIVGSATFDSYFNDEANTFVNAYASCVVEAVQNATTSSPLSLAINSSSFYSLPVTKTCILTTRAATVLTLFLGARQLSAQLNGCDFKSATITGAGVVDLLDVVRIPTIDGQIVVGPYDVVDRGFALNLVTGRDMWADLVPGVQLAPGEYGLTIDVEHFSMGPRIDLGIGGAIYVPVKWSSLALTGFDLVGGQRVVCRDARTAFPDGVLPCPRSYAAQYQGSEGGNPTTIPPGLIVAASVNETGRIHLAGLDVPGADVGDTPRIAGVLVTNCESPDNSVGGYCLVSSAGDVVVLTTPMEPFPTPGQALFLSAAVNVDLLGYVTATPPPRNPPANNVGPVLVGRVLPLGYDNTKTFTVAHFAPHTPVTQVSRAAAFAKTNNALAAVPGLSAVVRAGATYKFRLVASLSGGAVGGYKFALDTPDGAVIGATALMAHVMTNLTPAAGVELASVVTALGASVAGGVGKLVGLWTAEGFFEPSTGGRVGVYFAQSVTDAAASNVVSAVFEVVEQG